MPACQGPQATVLDADVDSAASLSVIWSQSVHSGANDSLRLVHSSTTQALYPTFGKQRIYQLQHVETQSASNVVRLLSAKT